MWLKKFVLSLVLLFGIALGPTSDAFAQDNSGWFFGGSAISTSTTTSLLVALPVGGVILTVVLVSRANKSEEAVENYINQNALAVQHDLYMGGGESARDLAQLLNIPADDFDAFAQALYENRGALMGLMEEGPVNRVGAAVFIQLVRGSMVADVEAGTLAYHAL